jgi:hypothetical protein
MAVWMQIIGGIEEGDRMITLDSDHSWLHFCLWRVGQLLGIATGQAIVSLQWIEVLTGPASPFIAISTISYLDASLLGHHILLLFFILNLRLSSLLLLGPKELRAIAIAACLPRHYF